MNIVIFGANGQTGRLLTQCVLDQGHSVTAVTRKPSDFPLTHSRLRVLAADVRRSGSLDDIVAGADAVLSTLGVGFNREKVDTYSVGTANIVEAMASRGVRRLVVVSSTGAYPNSHRQSVPLSLRLFEPIITRTIGKTVYDDIRRMETVVRASELDWTIVRPSGLFDLSQRTNYVAGEVDPVGAFTSRIDLAHYLTMLACDQATGGRVVTISTTEHTPTLWQVIRREAVNKPTTARPTTAPAS